MCPRWAYRAGSPPRCRSTECRCGTVWWYNETLRSFPGHRPGTLYFPEGRMAAQLPRQVCIWSKVSTRSGCPKRNSRCRTHTACFVWQSKEPPWGRHAGTWHTEGKARGRRMMKMFLGNNNKQQQESRVRLVEPGVHGKIGEDKTGKAVRLRVLTLWAWRAFGIFFPTLYLHSEAGRTHTATLP